MSQFAVQHVRFFKAQTQAVHCISYDTYSNKLAISRSDGSLEIYHHNSNGVKFTYDISFPSFIAAADNPSSIEALTWYYGRLFSAGINGTLIEYDMQRISIARSLVLDTSSIWALAATISSQTGSGLLACGSDSGNIYLVSLGTADEKSMEVTGPPLPNGTGRILSLTWVSEDKYLVAGGIGCIFVWKLTGSKPKLAWQINLPEKVVVWSLVAYPSAEPIFASSDSRGVVSIWNAKNGTMIAELSTHSLDVLTLSVGQVGKSPATIFAAGADPRVVAVMPISVDNLTGVDSWMIADFHKEHEHDVRASCFIAPNVLLTGGLDRTVFACGVNHFHQNRRGDNRGYFITRILPVFNWSNYVAAERISSTQTVLAFTQASLEGEHAVEIWQLLATPKDYEFDDDPNKEHRSEPERQLAIKLPCRIPPQIVKLSPLGNYLVFAAGSTVRAFKLDTRTPSAAKHFMFEFQPTKRKYPAPSVTDLAFCNHSSKLPLLALSADGQLTVRSLWSPEKTITYRLGSDFNAENSLVDGGALPTLFLRICPDEENDNAFTVLVASRVLVRLYKLVIDEESEELFSMESLCRLPNFADVQVTAVSVTCPRMVLVAFSNRRVAEFDGNTQRYTKWTRKTLVGASKTKAKRQKLEENGGEEEGNKKDTNETLTKDEADVVNAYPYAWLKQQDPISWVGYSGKSRSKILTVSSKLLGTIDKTKPLPLAMDNHIFKSQNTFTSNRSFSPDQIGIKTVSRFRYVLSFHCLKEFDDIAISESEDDLSLGELLIAELPEGEFKAQLPQIVVTKKQFAA